MDLRLELPMAALLREVARKHGIDSARLQGADGTWRLTDAEAEQLIDAVSTEFAATGLGPDSEPTSRGMRLEELIDRLNWKQRKKG